VNSLQRYKPKHEPGCACVVCWTAAFCDRMHERNDARQKRCDEILANPEVALQPVQTDFLSSLDEVTR